MKKYFIKLLGVLIFILPVTLFIALASVTTEAMYHGTSLLIASCILVAFVFPVLIAWGDFTDKFMSGHFGENWLVK